VGKILLQGEGLVEEMEVQQQEEQCDQMEQQQHQEGMLPERLVAGELFGGGAEEQPYHPNTRAAAAAFAC